MAKVLVIGAGGVGNVVVPKLAQASHIFEEIMLASRTVSKCESIALNVKEKFGKTIHTTALDADNVPEIVALINSFKPDLVLNVALPYQDLTIMDACLETKVDYLDTANYEPIDEAKFEYSWQWAYHDRYKEAGITAVLGCGFDPGVTGVFTAYAKKHYFDEIHYLDIVDCNAGDHGKYFATNFNPEINIREITQNGKYWENGQWTETKPLEIHKPIEYPNIGARESYILYHEELESLVKNFPEIKRARFWMTFGERYITALTVLQEVGLTSIKPIKYQGIDIVPLQFLKAVLPEPASLGENYKGETSIGCQIRGIKDGKERTYYVWNNCNHAEVYREIKAQAVAYTTGVPAAIGAMLMIQNKWKAPGVFNVEQFNPDPFMQLLPEYGLPWHEEVDKDLPVEK
jgi:saccharopine dehydrogenase (NAD+, L-lysine forming)